MPGYAVPAALGQGLDLPGLRPRALHRVQGPRGLPVQPLQAPGRPDRRDGVPLDQVAASHVVFGDRPPNAGQGRDGVGQAGAPARHPAADSLADEAQADGGNGRARRRQAEARGSSRVDDAYLGGARSRGKRGRGAAGKSPFVAALETIAQRKPRRLRLTVVKGFRKQEIETLAKRDFAAGSNVVTDGLSCWTEGSGQLAATPSRWSPARDPRPRIGCHSNG
jgi:hypothetical protein